MYKHSLIAGLVDRLAALKIKSRTPGLIPAVRVSLLTNCLPEDIDETIQHHFVMTFERFTVAMLNFMG